MLAPVYLFSCVLAAQVQAELGQHGPATCKQQQKTHHPRRLSEQQCATRAFTMPDSWSRTQQSLSSGIAAFWVGPF